MHDLMVEAFTDLALRRGYPPHPAPVLSTSLVRLRHIARTDPGGCWAAEDEDGLSGVAMATLREGVWGLSLLVVAPRAQSGGVGRSLLARTLDYGAPHRAAYILSSDDPRAIRAYARAGFDLVPTMRATGVPAALERPQSVRVGDSADVAATAAVDRRTRGGARPQDVAALIEAGRTLLVHAAGGYAVAGDGTVFTLSATEERTAIELLRAALAITPAGERAAIEFIAAGQEWAVGVALDAELDLEPYGPYFVRGVPGDLRFYLPSGAYL